MTVNQGRPHHFALALISQEREREYVTLKVGRQLCGDLQTVHYCVEICRLCTTVWRSADGMHYCVEICRRVHYCGEVCNRVQNGGAMRILDE